VPVVLQLGAEASITAALNDGFESVFTSNQLPSEISHSIFMKRGEVSGLFVTVVRNSQ
jgi:hypothetical protein